MPGEFAGVVLGGADVPLQDVSIARAGGERGGGPRQRPDSSPVPSHPPNLLTLCGVPYLHLAVVRAHREVRPALRPPHAAHGVPGTQVA